MARKKGAQPGNINALKHGFYSRFFVDTELTDLESITPDLTPEIAMLRVITRRLFDRLSTMEPNDDQNLNYDNYTALVQLLSSSTVRLASMMRTNQFLTGQAMPLEEVLKQALQDTIDELGVK